MMDGFQPIGDGGVPCSGEAIVRRRLVGKELPDVQGISGPGLNLLRQRFHNLMELQLEPLYAQLSGWTGGAMAYPSAKINSLWEGMLTCGGENELRPLLAEAEELYRQAMRGLVRRIDRAGMESDSYFLTVVNTLPYDRAEMIEADLNPGDDDSYESFGLLDERGNPVEYDLLQQHQIRFRAVVPAGGFRTYTLFRRSVFRGLDTAMRPAPRGWVMQNEFMRVVVGADGQVDLLDSETGIESQNVFGFDMGASSVFDASTGPEVSIIANKGVLLEYGFGVKLDLSLDAGSRHLTVSISFDGHPGKDRLRLLVHTDVHSDECISSQPFGCVCRSNDQNNDVPLLSNGLVTVRDWNKQMTIFSMGLCEYEHLRDERGTIALGLADASSSKIPYRLAIRPGQTGRTALMREMQCFQVPLPAVFDAVDRSRFTGGGDEQNEPVRDDVAYRLPAEEEQVLPPTQSGMAVDESMVFSAFKQSQDGTGWIMRFFNPSDAPVKVSQPKVKAKVSDLDERPGEVPWLAGATVGAEKIVTLRF